MGKINADLKLLRERAGLSVRKLAARLNAAFSPGVVTFGSTAISYTLDRQTLALIRKVHRFGWTERGQCKLQKVPKRAF